MSINKLRANKLFSYLGASVRWAPEKNIRSKSCECGVALNNVGVPLGGRLVRAKVLLAKVVRCRGVQFRGEDFHFGERCHNHPSGSRCAKQIR